MITQIKRRGSDNWWKSSPVPSTLHKETSHRRHRDPVYTPSFEDYAHLMVAATGKTWYIYFIRSIPEAVIVLKMVVPGGRYERVSMQPGYRRDRGGW